MKHIIYQTYFYFRCFTFATLFLCILFTKYIWGQYISIFLMSSPISKFTEQLHTKKHQLQEANVKLYWVIFPMMKNDFVSVYNWKATFLKELNKRLQYNNFPILYFRLILDLRLFYSKHILRRLWSRSI